MDPHTVFCPNLACPARGQLGRGNIRIHSQKEGRYHCKACDRTFTETRGTPFFRCRVAADLITLVLTLIAHGCPVMAIVRAFGFQARTIRRWVEESGAHCRALHEQQVLPQELVHVQADELRVKLQGHGVWLGMAIAVPSRLWLGAVVSQTRDRRLLARIAGLVRQWSVPGPLLIAVDGLKGYVTAFQRALREPLRTGKAGRPRLVAWPSVVIGQVVKQYERRRVVGVSPRLAQGSVTEQDRLLRESEGGQVLNTAFIERLNATFRARLSLLGRRTRQLGRQAHRLEAAVYLIGTVYNFCSEHTSIPYRNMAATPAMLAGLTDHCWSVGELLWSRVPPPAWRPPQRRGRCSRAELELQKRWSS